MNGVLLSRFEKYSAILSSVSELNMQAIHSVDHGIPTELREIADKFINVRLEMQRREVNVLAKVATQVAHDIRSPLAALKSSIENHDGELGNIAIEQIESIAQNLLKEHKKELVAENLTGLEILFINELVSKSIKLKLAENQNCVIYTKVDPTLQIHSSAVLLLRALSNLINDAFEYGFFKPISIEGFKESNLCVIEVLDQGEGFTEEDLTQIKNSQNVINPNGNGIGLSSTIETISKLGGMVEVENRKDMSGAIVRLKLPLYEQKDKVVLIDDNILVARDWKTNRKGVTVDHYKDLDSFRANILKHSKETEIYMDSDLGKGVKGEIEAKKIYELGFKNITLVTSHESSHFAQMPWIKEIRGKEFPKW